MSNFEVPISFINSENNDDKKDIKNNANWEQYSYCIINDDEDEVNGDVVDQKFPYDNVIQLLKKSLNDPYNPPKPPLSSEQARTVCLNNLIHQVDLILRKSVKEHFNHIKSLKTCFFYKFNVQSFYYFSYSSFHCNKFTLIQTLKIMRKKLCRSMLE